MVWCDVLSVTVGLIDVSVVVAFVGCFVYLKVTSMREEEDGRVGEHDNENDDEESRRSRMESNDVMVFTNPSLHLGAAERSVELTNL